MATGGDGGLLLLHVTPPAFDNVILIKFQKCAPRNFSMKQGFKGDDNSVATER